MTRFFLGVCGTLALVSSGMFLLSIGDGNPLGIFDSILMFGNGVVVSYVGGQVLKDFRK